MTKIVVGVFEDMDDAERALSQLQSKGFSRGDIDVRTGEKLITQWSNDTDDENDGFWASIKHFFTGSSADEERRVSGVSEADVIVTVHARDEMADEAADILDQYGAVDLDERAGGAAGMAGASPNMGEADTGVVGSGVSEIEDSEQLASGARRTTTGQKIPIVEEELRVGKRAVTRGGVRVRSRIIEQPVEEEVSLRDEKVHVERQPVDRPASAAGDNAFQEQSFEVREVSEEPVVEKRARVTEEVNVTKQSRQRKEKVQDTVRRTDVQVEQLSPEEQREFASYESEFQNEWQAKYASSSGMKYQDALPGYQYGYRLGRDPQYSEAKWDSIEPQVKRDWDQRGYGPWERFKNAVRSGWERSHHH